MRVLSIGSLYPPYHLGGYELVWQAGMRALREAGHDVRVVAADERLGRAAGAPEDADVHRDLRWYWRDHEFPRLALGERLGLERHNRAVLRRHLAEHRADVVSWWSMGGMSLSLIEQVRRRGIPAVGVIADEWMSYGPNVDQWQHLWGRARTLAPVGDALSGVPTRLDLSGAARWLFISEDTRRAAVRERGVLADTTVLHWGVAADFTAAPPGEWAGRVLYAGRLDERKGVGTLLDALAELPEMTLRIVGDGEERAAQRLRERARPLGDRVSFEPGVSRSELVGVYAAADVVAFPVEWSEPWGLVPLEAMAVGRPVVATGLGGSGEYLEHEGNCLLFDVGDAEALRGALRRVAGDPALRQHLRVHGLATAAAHSEAAFLDALVAEHEARGR
jgi:glycosyltransferase involved in cell wall biosynthesis